YLLVICHCELSRFRDSVFLCSLFSRRFSMLSKNLLQVSAPQVFQRFWLPYFFLLVSNSSRWVSSVNMWGVFSKRSNRGLFMLCVRLHESSFHARLDVGQRISTPRRWDGNG